MIATDSLSLMFIGCFVIGLLFMLITAFTGHGHGLAHHSGVTVHTALIHATHGVHAATHTGQSAPHTTNQNAHGSHFSLLSIVNPLSIAIFLLGFGFFGYLLHSATGFALPLIFVLACIGGIVIAAILIIMLSRLF